MARRGKRAEQQRINVLTELKSPLVFFGFALSIMEGTLGAALLLLRLPSSATLILASMMTVIFLASIGVVAFLAYKTPEVVMAQEPQAEPLTDEIKSIAKQLAQSVESLVNLTAQQAEGQRGLMPPASDGPGASGVTI